jgi:hypothetical protein
MKSLQHYTIVQKPNAPLIAGFVFKLLSLPHTRLSHAFSILSMIAFIGWAVEEIHLGVNWFRRILGTVVLLSIFLRLLT